MEKIKLEGLKELKKQENLKNIPELVQKYIDTKKYEPEGTYFRIIIDERSDISHHDGIAYLNELIVERKEEKVFSTGMLEYRGAYAHSVDNWDLHFNNPTILEESQDKVVFALVTGVGNIKVYRFRTVEKLEKLVAFNAKEYGRTQERINLLEKVLGDPELFFSYVEKGLTAHWHTGRFENLTENVYVLLTQHSDSDYDPVTDEYRFYIWVKSKGIGRSRIFETELYHPPFEKYYHVKAGSSFVLVDQDKNFAKIKIEMSSKQKWEATHNLLIEW